MRLTDSLSLLARRLTVGWNAALAALATYLLPLALVLFSAVAALVWPNALPEVSTEAIPVRLVQGVEPGALPASIASSLKDASPNLVQRVRLSNDTAWWLVAPPALANHTHPLLVFPSRHALDLACWNAATGALLGSASRQPPTQGALRAAGAGFALDLRAAGAPEGVVCNGHFAGPGRVSAHVIEASDLALSLRARERAQGLLDGGMVVLALSVAVAGLINRDAIFLLFSSWLMLNLRMAVLSSDWGSEWLGSVMPADWQVPLRSISLALYYTVTAVLFHRLFKDALTQIRSSPWMDLVLWTCAPLLLAAPWVSYNHFLPFVWVYSAFGVGVLGYLLVQILIHVRTAAALWYAAAMGVSLVASLHEVVSAWLGLSGLLWVANSVTAALASSVLASVAVAERLRAEHRERLSAQSALERSYQVIPIGLFSLNLGGRFVSANPSMLTKMGATASGLCSQYWSDRFGSEAWDKVLRTLMNGGTVNEEFDAVLTSGPASGETRRYWVRATLLGARIEGSLQDITEKSRAMARLEFLASHDAVTRSLNRFGLEKALLEATSSALDNVCLALLDLSRFKLINDMYGHQVGDSVLQQVCERVQAALPPAVRLGHLGGGEFLIVMPQTGIAVGERLAAAVLSAVTSTSFHVERRTLNLHASMGLIEVAPGMGFKTAVANVDRACAEAKHSKVDGLVVYRAQSPVFVEHEAELELAARLSHDGYLQDLYLEMQPIMSSKHPNASLNFEVLLRMRGVQGGVVPTGRLIKVAESCGRMTEIDEWVLRNTLAWVRDNVGVLKNNLLVCVNLSGASLNDEKFKTEVFGLLAQYQEVLDRMCLEITESVALRDLQNTRLFIDRVRALGAKVALDDFGAGYTSFTYLRDLPADILKIDGSFIVEMNRHPANVAIVETMVGMAQNLGMKVVAEWAEDLATLETLAELGVDYVQGYVVSRPMPPHMLLGAVSSTSFTLDENVQAYMQALQTGQSGGHLLSVFEAQLAAPPRHN